MSLYPVDRVVTHLILRHFLVGGREPRILAQPLGHLAALHDALPRNERPGRHDRVLFDRAAVLLLGFYRSVSRGWRQAVAQPIDVGLRGAFLHHNRDQRAQLVLREAAVTVCSK